MSRHLVALNTRPLFFGQRSSQEFRTLQHGRLEETERTLAEGDRLKNSHNRFLHA